MAVTKTPRKKPASAVAAEEKPAKAKAEAKAKAAPAKKAVETIAAKPAAEPVAAKIKGAARGKGAKTAVAVPEPLAPQAPEPGIPAPGPEKKAAAATAAPATIPELAQAILSAICEGRAVEFLFADAEANAPRTFEPRHLTFDALSQAWYVWGWDRRYNAERHHRVDLLAEVNAVEGAGRAAQGPYAEGTPANLIGGWLGGDPIHVKATLLKQWVFAVKQAPPAFPNFKIEEQSDGQALVSFTATDLRAISRWAMQFGDGIQVLEPARLVDRIKQVGAVWAGRERLGSPAPAPKPAPRPEPAPEPRRHESRPAREPREHRAERGPEREQRPEREREEAPKSKPGKIEVIRFDRL
ncbi:MAG: WYL domain-containing protein [Acidobacteria bacterium]|nr:WYL domain-containing protein [Acidobacteriota bacterium]MBI3489272.1 WYL domain-containing protein [Acidobacteriota bacterium]